VDGLTPTPSGYVLPEGRKIADVLAVEEDLLESEGIDPKWPGFTSTEQREAKRRRS